MKKMKTNNKKLLIVGYPHAPHTQHQLNYFAERHRHVICVNPGSNQGRLATLSWDDQEEVRYLGESLKAEDLQGILLGARAAEIPPEAVFKASKDGRVSWEQWYRQYCLQHDRSSTLLGLLLAYEHSGVPMINPGSRSLLSARKPYQLHILRSAKCPLPRTLVSNDPEKAREFILAHPHTIAKPASGGALTISGRELLKENRLEGLRDAPAILQERIYGDDIRVIVVDDQVVSSVAIGVPEGTIDFRGDLSYQKGQIHYKTIELPETIQSLCIKAVKALGLRFSGIDLKRTADNEYYFLECNSGPLYLDVERKTGHPITETLFKALMRYI